MKQGNLFSKEETYQDLLEDLLDEIDGGKWYTIKEIVKEGWLPFSANKISSWCKDGGLQATNYGTEKKAAFRIIGNEIKRFIIHGPRQVAE